jgi:hypothetical protein
MRSDAATVDEYLASLPEERREALSAVRRTILEHLPPGYVETMGWGMIAYVVPLETHPDTYNGQPLMYAALASQKHHMAVYLTGVYSDDAARERFLDGYRASGNRPDVGKSCVRFKRVDDLPLDVVGDAIGSYGVGEFVRMQEEIRARR